MTRNWLEFERRSSATPMLAGAEIAPISLRPIRSAPTLIPIDLRPPPPDIPLPRKPLPHFPLLPERTGEVNPVTLSIEELALETARTGNFPVEVVDQLPPNVAAACLIAHEVLTHLLDFN